MSTSVHITTRYMTYR